MFIIIGVNYSHDNSAKYIRKFIQWKFLIVSALIILELFGHSLEIFQCTEQSWKIKNEKFTIGMELLGKVRSG